MKKDSNTLVIFLGVVNLLSGGIIGGVFGSALMIFGAIAAIYGMVIELSR